MNYSGFLRPAWWWLRGDHITEDIFSQAPAPLYGGGETVAAMQAFRAGVPWDATLNSWTLLDSHDMARFGTVTGSRDRHLVGLGLQITTPGVPMLFAGDELGLGGEWGEDARRTMPWDRAETWDTTLLGAYRAARRAAPLERRARPRRHPLRCTSADDAIAYLRETRAERLLCLAARAPHDPIATPFAELETLYGGDARDGVLPADGPAFHIWRITWLTSPSTR